MSAYLEGNVGGVYFMIDILMINSGPRPSSALEVLVHGLFCFEPKFFHEFEPLPFRLDSCRSH